MSELSFTCDWDEELVHRRSSSPDIRSAPDFRTSSHAVSKLHPASVSLPHGCHVQADRIHGQRRSQQRGRRMDARKGLCGGETNAHTQRDVVRHLPVNQGKRLPACEPGTWVKVSRIRPSVTLPMPYSFFSFLTSSLV